MEVIHNLDGTIVAKLDFHDVYMKYVEKFAENMTSDVLDANERKLNSFGWYKQRTCKDAYDGSGIGIFDCSACGETHLYDWDSWRDDEQIKFCPNCGAKVVDDASPDIRP